MFLKKTIIFILQAVAVGIIAALIMIFVLPNNWLQERRQVVTIQTSDEISVAPDRAAMRGPFTYADAVNRAAPAVVNIYTKKLVRPRDVALDEIVPELGPFNSGKNGDQQNIENLGSGVIISEQGYILTNHHVIENAEEIEISLMDGRSLPANVVGADPETDLAVLQIHSENLPTIRLGNSSRLTAGDVVLAIGNPFGVGQTVTQGIVSATGRDRLGVNVFENYIQTDAAINPGNSGGALINAYGELIGINTLISSNSGSSNGIGFAIPIRLAEEVMVQMIEFGRVVRGWIGVQMQNISPQLSESFGLSETGGVLVSGVVRDGPAHNAGLYPGDIITSIDENAMSDEKDVLFEIIRHRPNRKLIIQGIRKGKSAQWEVEVGQRPIYGSSTY